MRNDVAWQRRDRCWTKGAGLAVVLGVGLLPAAALPADVKDAPSVQPVTARGAKISQEQAREAALKIVPGEVTDTTVEKKLGKMVYVIEIVAKNGGEETDVLVDMDTGKVLAVEK